MFITNMLLLKALISWIDISVSGLEKQNNQIPKKKNI